jgi:tetratricopeptide (TPR) repeat protein
MSKRFKLFLFLLTGIILLSMLIYQIPAVKLAIDWRVEKFTIYVKNSVNPPGPVPTGLPVTLIPVTQTPRATPSLVATPEASPTLTATPEFLPTQISLNQPAWERQTPNNCGPNALAFALRMYGWEGTQDEIAAQIKPVTGDRNVNPDELIWYVRNNAGWLNMDYRVAGDIELLKRLLAHHYPVIVESVTSLDPNDSFGPNDDLWAAHYLLLTGYDDDAQTFTIMDAYHEENTNISYLQLEEEWQSFNYVYMFIYFPQDEAEIKSLLGADWDIDANRQKSLENAQAATESNSKDAFAWFNLGSNLVYFEKYNEAALAFDKAREISLPMRMFRYQFQPFHAYFFSGRIEDLLVLTDYALSITDKSEETWLWHGYGLFRKGDFNGALADWNKALKVHPNYCDAERAINDYIQPTYDLTNCSP